MFKGFIYLSIIVCLFSCVKYQGDDYLPKEPYDQQDTVSHIYFGLIEGWDFKTPFPKQMHHISFTKYRYDSIFDYDPYSNSYVTWIGQPAKAWFYDSITNGRYKARFLVNDLLDTSVNPQNDYGNYIVFKVNQKHVGKPVVELIDTVGDRKVATLQLFKFNNFTAVLDTSRFMSWPAGRPSGKEMAKLFNEMMAGFDTHYRLLKRH